MSAPRSAPLRSSLLDAALTYAAAGVPVFPLRPRAKVPASAHGFLDATTDPAQIEGWWRRYPTCNVGLATGYQFDVIDFDSIEALAVYVAEADVEGIEADGPTCLTSRGAHTYVKPAGHPGCTPRPGVDYKAIGGYVVAPPSVHPDGTIYSWLPGYDYARPMSPTPSWLVSAPPVRSSPRFESVAAGTRPGDLYNASGALPDLLVAHGWSYAGKHGVYERWCRPGKTFRQGISATFNGTSFCVFSSAAECGPLAADGPYVSFSPFYAYALLEHAGDTSAAAAHLSDNPPPLVTGRKTSRKTKTLDET